MHPPKQWQAVRVVVYAAAALVALACYGYARSQREAARALDLYEQGRLVDARRALRSALSLNPSARWRDLNLAEVLQKLDRAIAAVEARSREPLGAGRAEGDRLARGRDLAMLGRTEAALALLDGPPRAIRSAEAANLRGAIYEARREYGDARHWYAVAELLWPEEADSLEKSAGLAVALRGRAYCERKRGRLIEAEAGYLALLRHAPTADHHFLAAQFYEDAQQARRAEYHAREAMRLDAARFGERGRSLIDKLATSHFGCWSVASEP